MEQWLAKIDRLKTWQASVVIVVIGFMTFFSGLGTPFMGDDETQIVNNPVVHSITNLPLFFEGSTFYNGRGIAPLSGVYYRPLMTTVFSLLATLFGPNPIYFHLFQLSICIGSAILLYLVFRYIFTNVVALVLALVFLVHPLNSQVVFALPSMQDALFFFFGILALWLLIRFRSVSSLFAVAICMFLSLLSKESGALFVGLAVLYLFWFDRKRLYSFLGIVTVPVILWMALKANAVGLIGTNPHNAPIDNLNLGGRLLTAPSIMFFYIAKLLFPLGLASAYYWIYQSFDVLNVLLPLLVDLAVIGLFFFCGVLVHRKLSTEMFHYYLFFSAWIVIGLLLHLQIIPLDMTVCETWFYFSTAGLLGMIGIILIVFQAKIKPSWFLVLAALIVGLLAFRTAIRGMDWSSPYMLATHDLVTSKEQFNAYNVLAAHYASLRDFNTAKLYASRSVELFTDGTNSSTLGGILIVLGDYSQAYSVLINGLKQQPLAVEYEDLAHLTLVYGSPEANEQFLRKSVRLYPADGELWFYYAVQLYRNGNVTDAKNAINKAATLSQIPPSVYNGIMNQQPFELHVGGNKTVTVQ